eukprot:2649269-Rhodomonas_salina.1
MLTNSTRATVRFTLCSPTCEVQVWFARVRNYAPGFASQGFGNRAAWGEGSGKGPHAEEVREKGRMGRELGNRVRRTWSATAASS